MMTMAGLYAPAQAISGTSDTSVQADKAARHARLLHSAQQFEAVMLSELMKPLGKPSAIGEDDSEQSSSPMQSYGVESVAGALARSGALGFANRIVAAVEKQNAKNNSEISTEIAKVPLNSADNPRGGN
jgi:Rod binding domain-containing protein